MIHGGVRYLEYDWETTRLSALDAGHIVRIARHLVHRIAFLIPVLPGDRNNLERMDTAMEVYDRFQPLKLANKHVRLTPEEALAAEPGLTPELVGAVTMEEWGVDPHRLAWANVQDAVAHGAQAHNHSRVVELVRDGGAVIGVRYRAPDGALVEARGRMVVNATGPWVPELCLLAGVEVRLRPAKGIHLVYDRRISNFSISTTAVDGRDIILVGHGPFSILGTTDDDFYGELDRPEVLPDEVEYLLQGFERAFPGIRAYRPVRATAGVRPTLGAWNRYEDDLSRHHAVFDHEARDGRSAFVTIAGGKLSMYRLMAEETADLVCRKLEVSAPGRTAELPLPGAEADAPPAEELARRHGLPALTAARLLRRHGCRAEAVLESGADRRGRISCRCELLSEAELAHAARSEQVRDLGDAFRRVGLASGPCAGAACVERAAEVVGRELGWSAGQRREQSADFLGALWAGRASVLENGGWAQEELAYGARRGFPG